MTSSNWHSKDKGTGRKRRAKIRKEGYRRTEKRKTSVNKGFKRTRATLMQNIYSRDRRKRGTLRVNKRKRRGEKGK